MKTLMISFKVHGTFDGRIAAKTRPGRAGDVNPPVMARDRAGSAAAEAHPRRYRPIDIDRTPSDIVQERIPSVFPACRASSISPA